MSKQPLALITGATSGIGLAIATLLIEKHYHLILVSRSSEKLQHVSAELGAHNIVGPICLDLAKQDCAEQLFAACEKENYHVDLLVNNVGVGVFGEFTEQALSSVTNMLELNIMTLTKLCHLFGKQMQQQKHGKILNIASTAAFQPMSYLTSYAASKSYVLHFSEGLNADLKHDNVNVYCLCPGATATHFMDVAGIGEQKQGVFAKRSLMTVEEVAAYAWRLMNSNKAHAIVGLKNHLLVFLNRLTPRAVVTYFSRLMLKPMLKKNK